MKSVDVRKVDHPDFRYCCVGAQPFTFGFERSRFIQLEGKDLEDYQRRKSIVESNGGRMLLQEFEAGGQRPTYSTMDVGKMVLAVEEDNPDLTIVDTWNGFGCYTFSVGCVPKKRKK